MYITVFIFNFELKRETKTLQMESYREQVNLSLPPEGTKVYIEYMAGCEYSIIWSICPDGENVLYTWIKSKSQALSIIQDHGWIDISKLHWIVEKQKKRIKTLKSETKSMGYKLVVKETGSKSGKYYYQVIDETGKIIKERKSNREYVACTVFHNFYFGRLDLIGKGDHGRLINFYTNNVQELLNQRNISAAEEIKKLNTIAYK